MNTRFRILLSSLVLFGLFSCGGQDRQSGKPTIAVIPKGTTLLFWQSVHAGAIKAAGEMEVNINWIGPEREDARQQQIGIVDNQAINQLDGIVLAPLDAMALRRPVEAAGRRGYVCRISRQRCTGGRIAPERYRWPGRTESVPDGVSGSENSRAVFAG